MAGTQQQVQPKKEMMTLEDFLLKAEEAAAEVKEEGFSGGICESSRDSIGKGDLGKGRAKRSFSLSERLDKAAELRERRMIKNRESAARSRERKQAYEAELELMVARLEEENDGLLKEKAENKKKRLKQLMQSVIPVTEMQRPPRFLRKIGSM